MSKYIKSIENKFDRNSSYSISEAIDILLSIKRPSFAESVDVAFNLGVNPRHAEENIRLSINLPNGVGREVSVLAIVNADKEQEAKDAGADLVGKEEFLEKNQKWMGRCR